MLSNLELYVAKAYQRVGDTEIEIPITFNECIIITLFL